MQQIPKQQAVESGKTALCYFVIFIAAGALYVSTCAPTVLWQDSGLFVYRIWHNDIQGNLGLALAHPLYFIIGIAVKQIPFGELAYKINLMSAVFGAVAIANLFLLLKLWLGKNLPAIIAAITLALSWTFWQHAVLAEVYTLYVAQMLGELIVLLMYVRTKRMRYLYLLGLFNGLAIANHLWAMLALGCYTVLIIVLLARKHIGLKHLCIVILLWVIGALPYEYLIIKNIVLTGDVLATLGSALFGNGWSGSVVNVSISMKTVLENIIFIILNFPTPNFVFFFTGLWVLRKTGSSRGFCNVILGMIILYFVFAFRYTVPDRYAFFVPFYCFAAMLVGIGADVFLRRYKSKALVFIVLAFTVLPAVAYFFVPAVARKYYKPLAQRRQRPYRDEYEYFLKPWKSGYHGAERFATEALEAVEKNAIIYAYTTEAHALLYVQQVKSKRGDVKIVSVHDSSQNAPAFNEDTIEQLLANSIVYVTSAEKGYCPQWLLDRYDFVQAGILWKVVGGN